MKELNNKLYTALITPFKEGRVDFPSLDHLIQAQTAVSNGLLLLGSTAENLALKRSEKFEILRFTCRKAVSQPIVAALYGFDIEEMEEDLEEYERLPLDAYMLVAPIYSKAGPKGQIEWFLRFFNKVTRPIILYNVPSRTGSPIYMETLEELKNHPRLWALKDSSGLLKDFSLFREKFPQLALYCGNDELLSMLVLNEKTIPQGLISVVSNIYPKEFKQYVHTLLEGKPKISAFDRHLIKALQTLSYVNPVSIKKLAFILGNIPSPECRLPLSSLDGTSEEELIESHKYIESYFNPH